MGRPRLYESDSAKLQAFRQRLDSSGFVRKEALIKTDTLAEISRLAKTHGVPEADVTGSLVELGLKSWQQACLQGSTTNSLESGGIAAQVAGAMQSSAQGAAQGSALGSAQVAAGGAVWAAWVSPAQPQASLAAVPGDSNPITQFFAQRKAAHHAAQPQQPEPSPSKPRARDADKPTDELADNSGGDPR